MKRILTIQDISCVGKCSLTVALPIISACGIETCVLPTAVLSNHTAFSSFTFRDLTNDITDITKQWKKHNIQFDGLYTGYLGSYEQLELIKEIFAQFKNEKNFILVDPVMGDHGQLYKGFDLNFAKNMATLCKGADIIVPNLTEASFMLNIPYVDKGYDELYIKGILKKLTNLGCKKALLTGITFEDGKLGVCAYDSIEDKFYSYFQEHLPQSFHGTGDVFASTLCGCLTNNISFELSIKIAVDYTVDCIKNSISNTNHKWYGVDFESSIPYLIDMIKNNQ